MTRKIQIEFEVPEEHEEGYADVAAELVVEDFIWRYAPALGFKIISDSNPPKEKDQKIP